MNHTIILQYIKNGDTPSRIFDRWVAVASPKASVFGRWKDGRPDAVMGRYKSGEVENRCDGYTYSLLRQPLL